MKRQPTFLLALILIFAALGAQTDLQRKTIARIDDPITLRGNQLSPLVDAGLSPLSLLAMRGGSWLPIPFQIDQVKPDGAFAFTAGKLKSNDPDPNLDGNDELVFLARDLGDRAAGSWPAGAAAGVEIEVQDPKNGARGWAYLFRFNGNPPRTQTDYIELEIDLKNGRRWGRSEDLVVGAPLNRVYPDYIATRTPEGKMGQDILDRLKIRGELFLPGGIKIPFNADDLIYARDLGYIDGPVRAMQFTDGYMEFSGVELKGFGHSVLYYYPNQVICPITIAAGPKIPDWVLDLLPDGHVAGYMDFNAGVYGAHVISAANPFNRNVVLDGKMSAAEKALNRTTPIDWIAGYGPQGGIVSRLNFGPEVTGRSRMVTFFIDDPAVKDPPEDHPGSCSVGFDIIGEREGDIGAMARSSAFYLYFYGKHDLSPENIHTVLDILDHPLKARTTPLKLAP